MRGFKNEAWVTGVLSESQVGSSLVLCQSLKQVLTSRKLVALVSSQVSLKSRKALRNNFDFIFTLEDDEIKSVAGSATAEQFSLLFTFTLQSFDKCVWLSPDMFVVRNCDEIFDTWNQSEDISNKTGQPKCSSSPWSANCHFTCLPNMDTSVCLLKPALKVFNSIIETLQSKDEPKFCEFLRTWFKNQTPEENDVGFIDGKYKRLVTCDENEKFVGTTDYQDLYFVQVDKTAAKLLENGTKNILLQYWKNLYNQFVKPMLTGEEQMYVPISERYRKEPIAVVGMSCRYPQSKSLEEFWNLLFTGADGTSKPPEFRWLREQSVRNVADHQNTNAGFLNVRIDEFDNKFFGISNKDVVFMDPQQRILHEIIWEGLEDAAIDPNSLRGVHGGVFMGCWVADYRDILHQSGLSEFYRSYMGNSIGAMAARMSFILGLTGPCIATESGCSSSMVAVHMACKSLLAGESNMALACGVNLLLHQFTKDEIPMALAADGRCKTFSSNADGFGRAEGCAVVVLKRLSDAVKDGDRVWGLIRGSAMTQEGISKSMGTPTVHCEALAMTKALQDANVKPEEISYVEAHGTGTMVGDPLEVGAIAKAYSTKARKEPLMIGSVKTNIGHTEAVAGIAGLMKVILALHHDVIPPHINFEGLNPAIKLEAVPAVIPLELSEWKRAPGKTRYAGVSAFGIAGTDVHVIVEETPNELLSSMSFNGQLAIAEEPLERSHHLVKMSVKTEDAMEPMMEKYADHVKNSCESESFPDFAYTANIGRANFRFRAVAIGKTKEEFVHNIETGRISKGETISSESMGKVCFLFTGQGSQYIGMAKKLYETNPVFKVSFDRCETILRKTYKISIRDVLWGNSTNSEEKISRTIYSQTSIFCIEYALLQVWKSWGIQPDYCLGHSLGEFAAAVASGIVTFEDALKLVAERSLLIDELPKGKMLVIKQDKQGVTSLMNRFSKEDSNKILDFAAVNSHDQTVVAGDTQVVLEFSEFLGQNQIKYIILEASHAFHSKHMDPMLEAYRRVASTNTKPTGDAEIKCEYISGLRGTLVAGEFVNADYWVDHTREKVNFLDASKKALELGCKIFIEIGPQPVLTALTMMNATSDHGNLICLPSLKKKEDEWITMLNSLGKLYIAGVDVDWHGFDRCYPRKKIRLPHYPFQRKKFWPDLMAKTGAKIHPILGSPIPNASSAKIYECGLNVGSHLEWVKDHAIGENVIFPGAGFLEMCVAAGVAATEGCINSFTMPSRPVKVENLVIEAPLCLVEGESSTQVQTVVELDGEKDSIDLRVKISHRVSSDSSGNKWLTHTTATYCPLPNPEEQQQDVFNLDEVIATNTEETMEINMNEMYDKLSSIGLNFGPVFRSVEKLWRKNELMVIKVKAPLGDNQLTEYILHPVILDSLLQAIMMRIILAENDQNKLRKKLYVPIKIGKFVWLSAPHEGKFDEIYIRVYGNDTAAKNSVDCTAILMDSRGKSLAVMSGVEVIDTTVKAVESMIKQQLCAMPDLWMEVWKKQLGPLEHRLDLKRFEGDYGYTEEVINKLKGFSQNASPVIEEVCKLLTQFSGLSMLQALYDCGWDPKENDEFMSDDLFKQLKIQDEHRIYFGFILDVLEEEGMLEKLKIEPAENEEKKRDPRIYNCLWKVAKVELNRERLPDYLQSSDLMDKLTKHFSSTQLLLKVGESFGPILQGKQSALSILFPEDKTNAPSIGAFYEEYGKLFGVEEFGETGLIQRVNIFKEKMSAEKTILRILEIGAGTGAVTVKLLEVLEDLEVEFEYTYTDISAGFFQGAEKRFEKNVKSMKFKKLNIEEDPLSQGFIPEYYDYVVAGEVIHATRNIMESLANVRLLMRPGGKFDLIETTSVNRYLTYLVGLLPGYWRFQDLELRPKHCTMPKDKWRFVLEQSGYEVEEIFSCFMDQNSLICVNKNRQNQPVPALPTKEKVWMLFQQENVNDKLTNYIREKLASVNRRLVIVHHVKTEEEKMYDNLLCKIRMDCEDDFKGLLTNVSSGESFIEGVLYCWALDKSLTEQDQLLQPYFYLTKTIPTLLENPQQKTLPRVIALTEGIVPIEENDLSHYQASTLWGYSKSLRNEITEFNCRCFDITDADVEGSTRLEEIFSELFNLEKEPQVAYHGRTKYIPKFQPYKPSAQEQELKLPSGTDRFQLIHPETRAIQDLQFGPLDHFALKENEVEVQVKCFGLNFRDVLNVLKPTEQFLRRDFDTVGFDFCGEVSKVASGVTMWKLGDQIFGVNFDGSALPSHIKIREDYAIPVPDHIPLCQAATLPVVFSTAYHCLVSVANLKSSDVCLIHTATGGVGLSALDICLHYGVDINNIMCTAGSKRKRNFLRNLGIKHVFHSRNTSYADEILKVTNGRGVDVVLNSLTGEGFKEASLRTCAKGAWFLEMSKISIWSEEEIKQLRPDIRYYVIDIDVGDDAPKEWGQRVQSIREHFINLKMQCPLPMITFGATDIRNSLFYLQKARQIGKVVTIMPDFVTEDGQRKAKIPMFFNKSCYMITGGLGGIGFLVCQWMIEKGARYIILIGRNPPSEKVQIEIDRYNSQPEFHIEVVQCDVGNQEQCEELFVTKIPTMELPPLRGIMHCAGTLSDGLIANQDWEKMNQVFVSKVQGTVNLHDFTRNQNLEHFVLFSSIAGLFGPPAQSNHAAACNFEDTFAHYRHSIGLPATTINWGQWGDVGVATEMDFPGVRPISNLQGLTALEHAMRTHRTQTCVFNVDSFVLWSKLVPQLSVYLDERVWKTCTGGAKLNIKSEEFWQEYDSKTSFEEKVLVVKEYSRKILTSVLRLEEGEKLRDDIDLQEMGVDSLMFVEIKNALQALLGDRVTINTSALRECNTINLISEALVKQIEGEALEDLQPPSYEQVKELLRKDCILPEKIQATEEIPKQVATCEIKTVLLTGATGTLGVYMLRELVQLNQVERVVCLLRPKKDSTSLEERLRKVLDKRGISIALDKVECIPGNCASPHLGLEDATWQALSTRVDAVFNCFANVHHLEQYRERAAHIEDVRTVNIGGTKNILEFSCESRIKYVFHAASLVSVATTIDGGISENWPEPEDYDGVTTYAYPISKYVEDMLFKEAVCERGLPCKVFRLPFLSGDSKTGQFPVEQNHLMLRYIFVMKQGIMPSNPLPLILLPTDMCAQMMINLAFREDVPFDVYNITHNKPDIDQEFPAVAVKFGFTVKVVDFEEFADRVLNSGKEGEDREGYHPIFKEIYRDKDDLMLHYNTAPAFRQWMEAENSDRFFASKKIEKYAPEFYHELGRSLDCIERDLTYARENGYF